MPVNVKDASGATVAAVTLDDVIGAGKSLGTVILGVGSAIIGKVGIDQTTPGTTDSVSVKGSGVGGFQTVTRPANTTAYAIGDVVGGGDGSTTTAAITFTGFAAGEWWIPNVELYIGSTALQSGEGSYSLHLYNAAPATVLVDNAAWDVTSGDRAKYLGRIDLGTPVDLGSTIRVDTPAVNRQITVTGTTVLGFLQTNAAFTPGSATAYFVNLHAGKV
jgi:hypothetical protein